ncbi:MAG: histidine phosphatase family protein [Gammaproteobacteria bacterium]|nr:histidine phosphatase family protein [Gammaproteobacteria bacterium]MBU1861438.1 histidine phosphatase family protein [Gammaproteobacteria bacterium]
MQWRSGAWLLALCLLSGAAQADDEHAWTALREGRAVLLMRHATAPGTGDPANFQLGDCRTQRNLNQAGLEQAQRWGQLLQRQWIKPRLLSSRWCRAQDTAREMGIAAVEALPALDSFFQTPTTAREQTATLIEQINAQALGAPMVLVSHQVNITALTGIYPASGEGLILALPLQAPARVLARIQP